jgi:hypothetical protein
MKLSAAMLLLLGLLASKASFADTADHDYVQDFWNDTKISGDIRSYFFNRSYTNPGKESQSAYSLGGDLNILTGSFLSGFRIGAAVYTAQSLGLNSGDNLHVDTTLPGRDITTLGQAYLQYSRDTFLIRGGDQLINTPWLNAADSRMIPETYRGFFGTWTPMKDLIFTALRVYEFKSRVANDFSATNVYNPQNQGIPIAKLGDSTNDGAQAVGVNYKTDTINTQAWAYQFLDYAKLFYGDIQYTFKNKSNINPLIAAQFLTETGDGNNTLSYVSTGKANSTGYGGLVGVEMPQAKLTFAYNRIMPHADAFNHGGVVSPYTYTSDPLYTTSMIAGLVDKTPGEAWKVAGTVYAFEKQLQILLSYAQYYTEPYLANTDEVNFDVAYSFKKSKHKSLRGLSIRNRLGVMTGDPTRGTFYYNRVMLQYSF